MLTVDIVHANTIDDYIASLMLAHALKLKGTDKLTVNTVCPEGDLIQAVGHIDRTLRRIVVLCGPGYADYNNPQTLLGLSIFRIAGVVTPPSQYNINSDPLPHSSSCKLVWTMLSRTRDLGSPPTTQESTWVDMWRPWCSIADRSTHTSKEDLVADTVHLLGWPNRLTVILGEHSRCDDYVAAAIFKMKDVFEIKLNVVETFNFDPVKYPPWSEPDECTTFRKFLAQMQARIVPIGSETLDQTLEEVKLHAQPYLDLVAANYAVTEKRKTKPIQDAVAAVGTRNNRQRQLTFLEGLVKAETTNPEAIAAMTKSILRLKSELIKPDPMSVKAAEDAAGVPALLKAVKELEDEIGARPGFEVTGEEVAANAFRYYRALVDTFNETHAPPLSITRNLDLRKMAGPGAKGKLDIVIYNDVAGPTGNTVTQIVAVIEVKSNISPIWNDMAKIQLLSHNLRDPTGKFQNKTNQATFGGQLKG
jgi:cob(I)alamin adenosyltransferase